MIGGGAAGFFLAINLKEMMPTMEVTIFEKSKKVLAKVEISGGGRCNCTNSFAAVRDLSQVYPRGHRLMKRLFKTFNYQDAYAWFEQHGVRLVTQDDECVFPTSQDSHTIINTFLLYAKRLGVEVVTERKITSLDELKDYDFIVVTTGGMSAAQYAFFTDQDSLVLPVPSLFTFQIADSQLQALMGTVVETATAYIPGTNFKASSPLLITHWGMSGPAILRLSSYAARELYAHQYQMPLAINWSSRKDAEVQAELQNGIMIHSNTAGMLFDKLVELVDNDYKEDHDAITYPYAGGSLEKNVPYGCMYYQGDMLTPTTDPSTNFRENINSGFTGIYMKFLESESDHGKVEIWYSEEEKPEELPEAAKPAEVSPQEAEPDSRDGEPDGVDK